MRKYTEIVIKFEDFSFIPCLPDFSAGIKFVWAFGCTSSSWMGFCTAYVRRRLMAALSAWHLSNSIRGIHQFSIWHLLDAVPRTDYGRWTRSEERRRMWMGKTTETESSCWRLGFLFSIPLPYRQCFPYRGQTSKANLERQCQKKKRKKCRKIWKIAADRRANTLKPRKTHTHHLTPRTSPTAVLWKLIQCHKLDLKYWKALPESSFSLPLNGQGDHKNVCEICFCRWRFALGEDGTGAGLERNEAPQNKVNYIYVYFA